MQRMSACRCWEYEALTRPTSNHSQASIWISGIGSRPCHPNTAPVVEVILTALFHQPHFLRGACLDTTGQVLIISSDVLQAIHATASEKLRCCIADLLISASRENFVDVEKLEISFSNRDPRETNGFEFAIGPRPQSFIARGKFGKNATAACSLRTFARAR